MEIHVSQLVPGLTLTKDVIGKTNHPIVRKDTVLTEEHLLVLKKFMVNKVEVSRKRADGEKITLKERTINQTDVHEINGDKDNKRSFYEYYHNALIKYKDHFNQWKNNIPINIPEIRKFLLPLFETFMENEIELFKLHHYSTPNDYLYHHSLSVGLLSSFLARKMGFEKGECIQVGLAGFLSNAGMAKLDAHIVNKDGALTYLEREEVKKHPSYSYLLVKPTKIIKESVKLAVLQHHERLDGSGYPLGLVDDQINQYARIIAICDTYHAMTSERKYQKSQSPFKVIDELKKKQFTKFDPHIVRTFIQSFMNLSLGEKIKLTNNQVGMITFIEMENLTTPLIKLEDGGQVFSLKDDPNLSIIDFV